MALSLLCGLCEDNDPPHQEPGAGKADTHAICKAPKLTPGMTLFSHDLTISLHFQVSYTWNKIQILPVCAWIRLLFHLFHCPKLRAIVHVQKKAELSFLIFPFFFPPPLPSIFSFPPATPPNSAPWRTLVSDYYLPPPLWITFWVESPLPS